MKFVGEDLKNSALILSLESEAKIYDISECPICFEKINETNKTTTECGHIPYKFSNCTFEIQKYLPQL